MTQQVEILDVANLTHDVRRLKVTKPDGFEFIPGQATDVAIDRDGWRDQQRPFTFTSLNEWPELEFIIKIYPDHDGVTARIAELGQGDRLLIGDPWGAICFKGAGCFIAGGAGVTPFVAIIRDLQRRGDLDGNRLIFSNKTENDIILRDEFEATPGLTTVFTVTDQPQSPLSAGTIDKRFLKANAGDLSQSFYVCGPPKMVEDVSEHLRDLGANPESITFEE